MNYFKTFQWNTMHSIVHQQSLQKHCQHHMAYIIIKCAHLTCHNTVHSCWNTFAKWRVVISFIGIFFLEFTKLINITSIGIRPCHYWIRICWDYCGNLINLSQNYELVKQAFGYCCTCYYGKSVFKCQSFHKMLFWDSIKLLILQTTDQYFKLMQLFHGILLKSLISNSLIVGRMMAIGKKVP